MVDKPSVLVGLVFMLKIRNNRPVTGSIVGNAWIKKVQIASFTCYFMMRNNIKGKKN